MVTTQRPVIDPGMGAAFAFMDDKFYWSLNGSHEELAAFLDDHGITPQMQREGVWGYVTNRSQTQRPIWFMEPYSQLYGDSTQSQEYTSCLGRLNGYFHRLTVEKPTPGSALPVQRAKVAEQENSNEPDWGKLQAQVESLAHGYGAWTAYDAGMPNFYNQIGAWALIQTDLGTGKRRRIEVHLFPIDSEIHYFAALHEIGHLEYSLKPTYNPRAPDSQEEELYAWHYGLEHSLIPLSEETLLKARGFFNTYQDSVRFDTEDPGNWIHSKIADDENKQLSLDGVGEPDWEKLQKQVESLAHGLGASVAYDAGMPNQYGHISAWAHVGIDAYWWNTAEVAKITSLAVHLDPVKDEISYFSDLHELGHIEWWKINGVNPTQGNSQEEELYAWHYALEHSSIAFSEESLKTMREYFNTYKNIPTFSLTNPGMWTPYAKTADTIDIPNTDNWLRWSWMTDGEIIQGKYHEHRELREAFGYEDDAEWGSGNELACGEWYAYQNGMVVAAVFNDKVPIESLAAHLKLALPPFEELKWRKYNDVTLRFEDGTYNMQTQKTAAFEIPQSVYDMAIYKHQCPMCGGYLRDRGGIYTCDHCPFEYDTNTQDFGGKQDSNSGEWKRDFTSASIDSYEDWHPPGKEPKNDFKPGEQVEYLWANRPTFGYVQEGPFNHGTEEDPRWMWRVLFESHVSTVSDNYLMAAIPLGLHEPEPEHITDEEANSYWPDTFPGEWTSNMIRSYRRFTHGRWTRKSDMTDNTDATGLINQEIANSPAALKAFEALTSAGGQVHVVGGAVRDAFMGKSPKDIDLMCNGLTGGQIAAVLEPLGRVDLTGKAFGVYRFKTNNDEVEIAMPRTEQSTGEGHKDFSVTVDPNLTPEADLGRRDFTMNAMAYDPATGKVLDPHGGQQDIENKKLSLVSLSAFEDDPLRIVRALVATARYGFDPDPALIKSMQDNADGIRHLPGERIQMEMDKLLSAPDPVKAMELAEQTGLLDYIAPELSSTVGFDQQNRFHDLPVWDHTMKVLGKVATLSNDPDLRLAALFHDSGKPDSFWLDDEGNGHFYRKVDPTGENEDKGQDHEDVGASLVREFMSRLRYPNARIERVVNLVQNHMFPYFDKPKGARKFIRQVGDPKAALDLLKIREADASGKRTGEMNEYDTEKLNTAKNLVQEALEENHAVTIKDLAITGHDLIQMGLKPGPEIGHILKNLLERVIDDPELNTHETLMGMAQDAQTT